MSVRITYADLAALKFRLESIIEEYESSSDLAKQLSAYIGAPYGETRLQRRAEDFESRWDDRRAKLTDGLRTVLERNTRVMEGFPEFDVELAAEMSGAMSQTPDGVV